MYEAHFGLRQRPFRPTPDGLAYYASTGHEQALADLLRALGDGEGLLLITGTPGTGKTLLCQRLLARLGEGWNCAFLLNSHLTDRTAGQAVHRRAQGHAPRGVLLRGECGHATQSTDTS